MPIARIRPKPGPERQHAGRRHDQAALRCLMLTDKALEFTDAAIHDAAVYGLDRLLAAQYPNGAWPQRFTGPRTPKSIPSNPRRIRTRGREPTRDRL